MAITRDYIIGFASSHTAFVENDDIVQAEFNLDAIGDLDMATGIQTELKKLFDHLSSRFAVLHQEAVDAIERHDAIDKDISARMQNIDAAMMRIDSDIMRRDAAMMRRVEGSTLQTK